MREARSVRLFPRYVPCAVTLLAAHLELFRREAGTFVFIASNGGYRSPSHGLVDYASPHCWGTAANVYRTGDDFLDTQEKIERWARIAARVSRGLWIRPYGHDKGEADDHLHLDVGYAVLTPRGGEAPLQFAAVGMEAEFELYIDDVLVKPEDAFGDPRAFIRSPLMHRTGTSYHLPTGGVVYFDTGVIELATPVIELERGCAARAGRSLWESIRFVRGELDAWERATGHDARLGGFSTHYHISFELTRAQRGRRRTTEKLALLLSYILPVPVMLLATNRCSTGVGVRPRGNRIEITVDFTPSAALMIATGTLITGIMRAVMAWPSFDLVALERRGLPVIAGYAPIPHTSRKGWLARWDCYPANPFAAAVDAAMWTTTAGDPQSLRQIGERVMRSFWCSIRRLSDPFTFRLIGSVMTGRAPALLDLPDRPSEYDDVGRLCEWDDLFPPAALRRSRYERVLTHAIAGHRLRLDGEWLRPIGMRGWSEVVFRQEGEDSRRFYSIDYLLRHLDDREKENGSPFPPPHPSRRRNPTRAKR